MAQQPQRQISIAFPPDVRDRLEAAATAAGHSLAEEVRRRVESTLWDDDSEAERPDVTELMDEVGAMACLSELVTGNRWTSDPNTAALLLLGIGRFIERAAGQVDVFADITRLVERLDEEACSKSIPLSQQFHRKMVETVRRPKESWGEHWQEAPEAIADILADLIGGRLKRDGLLRTTIASHVQQGRKLRANLIQQMEEGEGKDGE